jgi:DNA-directed RNA polymerase subunit M/transcription elongation factor TFIIS
MTEKVISAGDEVDSYCTTCKLMLAHQVVALVDGKVEKVVCKTCGRKHKYRPNLPKSRQKKTTKTRKTAGGTTAQKTTRTRRRKDPSIKWEETLSEHDVTNPKDYSIYETFNQHDIIMHKKFGRGIIIEVREEGKMEVMFKEGTKVLIYGRASALI